jgi:hypothetical protein
MQRPFGLEAKVAALRDIVELSGELSDAQLVELLKDSDYDINLAACRVYDGDHSNARRADVVQQQPSTKRPRSGDARKSAPPSNSATPWTSALPPAQHTPQDVGGAAQQHAAELRRAELRAAGLSAAELGAAELGAAELGAPPTPSWERRALEAEARAAEAEAGLRVAGSGGTSGIFTVGIIADLGRALARVVITPIAAQITALPLLLAEAVVTPLTKLIEALPSQFAKAVREYDETEAVRVAADAAETLLERQVSCCRTCTEIGKLECLDFVAHQNKIYCLNCQRYGAYAPKQYLHGARCWGVFDGTHARDTTRGISARELKSVKSVVKRHIQSSLHPWCDIHAVEEAIRNRKTHSVGMTCAPLPWCDAMPIGPRTHRQGSRARTSARKPRNRARAQARAHLTPAGGNTRFALEPLPGALIDTPNYSN